MRTYFRWTMCALALSMPVAVADRASGQVPHASGQNVAPVFEGWEKNADGTFSLVFGYLNRNYEEEPEIPIGPNNSIEPGGPDRGQPTHFYPRRQQFTFTVRVPADFGKKEVVWTLTHNGRTDKARGTLLMEEELTQVVMSQNRGGLASDMVRAEPNQPPIITIAGPAQRIVSLGDTVTLTALVSDDGIPKPLPPAADPGRPSAAGSPAGTNALVTLTQRPIDQQVVKPNRQGLAVTWTHHRGPGRVTFEPMNAVVRNGMVTAKVTFSQPGTYVIRAYADDGVLLTPADVTITVTGPGNTSEGQP